MANNPENPADGTRQVAFSGELWIEADDFAEVPPPKFFRLTVGREVRLRGAYLVTATGVEKDAAGDVVAVHATYDPATRGGDAPDGRKVKSTMHWVSAAARRRRRPSALYERLFTAQVPGEAHRRGARRPEPELPRAASPAQGRGRARRHRARPGACSSSGSATSPHDPTPPALFHRTVGLRDEWAAIQKRQG